MEIERHKLFADFHKQKENLFLFNLKFKKTIIVVKVFRLIMNQKRNILVGILLLKCVN